MSAELKKTAEGIGSFASDRIPCGVVDPVIRYENFSALITAPTSALLVIGPTIPSATTLAWL